MLILSSVSIFICHILIDIILMKALFNIHSDDRSTSQEFADYLYLVIIAVF